jgi:hypothetical protein
LSSLTHLRINPAQCHSAILILSHVCVAYLLASSQVPTLLFCSVACFESTRQFLSSCHLQKEVLQVCLRNNFSAAATFKTKFCRCDYAAKSNWLRFFFFFFFFFLRGEDGRQASFDYATVFQQSPPSKRFCRCVKSTLLEF